jgi:Icc-related predicted phosphoesterase
MRILHVADLHLQHAWFDWVASHGTEFDVLVIAGDLQDAFSNTPMHDQARAISKWLLALETPTIVCSGNHDYWTSVPRVVDRDAEAAWLRRLVGKGKLVVDGDLVDLGGLSITANGWLHVPNLPFGATVVVTHAPPAGCPCAQTAGDDIGDPVIWNSLSSRPPRLLLCGHVHQPRWLWCRWPSGSETTLVLVPGCDEQTEIPAHWVIDTDEQLATHSSGQRVSSPP